MSALTSLGSLLFSTTTAYSLFILKRRTHTNSSIITRNMKAIAESIRQSRNGLVDYWLAEDEKYRYLEEIRGKDALDWVKERNQHALQFIGNPKTNDNNNLLFQRVLSSLNSHEKIPNVSKIGQKYYNIWKDKSNPKGLIRRTTFDSFCTNQPQWETVLDLDILSQQEQTQWVFNTWTVNEPDNIGCSDADNDEIASRILLHLSIGGSDAVVIREFDLVSLQFVDPTGPQQGFYIPVGKSNVSWKSKDTLLIGIESNDKNSLTLSGYPREVREWNRGTPLLDSKIVFSGVETDVINFGYVSRHRGFVMEFRTQCMTFYSQKVYLKLIPGANGQGFPLDSPKGWNELLVPEDASVSHCLDQLIITLRSPWKLSAAHGEFPAGSLLAINAVSFLRNDLEGAAITVLFVPTSRSSLESTAITRSFLVLHILDNVQSKLAFWRYDEGSDRSNGIWTYAGAEASASVRGVSITAVDQHENDLLWLTTYSFIQPTTLLLIDANQGGKAMAAADAEMAAIRNGSAGEGTQTPMKYILKQLPAQYDAKRLVEYQREAISADGTVVPYFIVHRDDIVYDGSTPTILYGYGGFEVSLTPTYATITGLGWLERGGCYVCSNIRGGGEFGPDWHKAAVRENKIKSYEDYIAVAEHLIQSKVTSPSHLGIRGGSNGGLLVCNTMLLRPDLFGAVTSAVPLTDMRKYHKLLAGASWMEEYGNPDKVEEWKYLQRYSAFHNIDPRSFEHGGPEKYPVLLVTTSTNDDRVHPYHARCFVKRMLEAADCRHIAKEDSHIASQNVAVPEGNSVLSDRVFYYENTEGGHGGAADNEGVAFMSALYLDFLWRVIGPKVKV